MFLGVSCPWNRSYDKARQIFESTTLSSTISTQHKALYATSGMSANRSGTVSSPDDLFKLLNYGRRGGQLRWVGRRGLDCHGGGFAQRVQRDRTSTAATPGQRLVVHLLTYHACLGYHHTRHAASNTLLIVLCLIPRPFPAHSSTSAPLQVFHLHAAEGQHALQRDRGCLPG
jgi:hypothetical protein